jgi:hypothetical protein
LQIALQGRRQLADGRHHERHAAFHRFPTRLQRVGNVRQLDRALAVVERRKEVG